ncbi:hypothetical protein BCM27_04630 [Gordonia terrae]|nr:hypothetical protein BCM27_04630 [Gordonia terrae]
MALLRSAPDVHIAIFDTRPTPFGLLRYGVAPDHQGMKNVSRQFDRLFASDRVDFVGNTTIGRDLPLDLLEDNFDVVVLATGLAADRPLEVPVDPAAPVYGAGQLLRFLNGDPDSTLRSTEPRPLGEEVLIVGTGNVAMDVARLLCKAEDGFHNSDIDDDARESLETANIRQLTLLSRGPRDRVRWDASMFAELCALPGVTVYLDGQLEERSADTNTGDGRGVRVDVRFRETPISVDTGGRHCVVRTRFNGSLDETETASGTFVHHADTVITAMGFVDGTALDDWTGRGHIVRVGGCGSGSLGNLAENRSLAKEAARQIVDHLGRDAGHTGLDGVRPHLPPTSTTFDDWTLIDRAEVGRARPGRVRRKFTTWTEMSDVVRDSKK